MSDPRLKIYKWSLISCAVTVIIIIITSIYLSFNFGEGYLFLLIAIFLLDPKYLSEEVYKSLYPEKFRDE